MDNQRLIIWSFFGFMCILTYQAWTIDSTQNEIVVEQAYEENELSFEASPQLNNNLPKLSQPDRNNVTPVIISDNDFSEIITVKTDVLELKINSKGGTIEGAKLLKYPKSKDQPDDVIELLNTNSKDLGLIQTGLRSLAGAPEPNHLASYSSDSNNYELTHQGELIIPLYWTDGNGIKVEKSFRVSQGSYRVDIEHRLTNDTAQDWSGASYSQITRRVTDKERSMFDVESFSFDGPIIFNGEKIEKLDSSDLNEDGPNQFVSSNGWIGSIQHHFLSAVVPEKENEQRYQVSANKVRVVSNMIGPTEIVYSNQTKTFSTTAYIGPKLQSQLNAIDPKLRLSVDYGILTMLSQPLFWLLNFVHSFVQNWGLAIISVTAIIKLLFYKLTEKSGHSMAKMRAIAPRLKAIQERYKDNKTEQGRATMELYKREKVNPIAGCVPMLIQMPFFLAFYWVLLESVEMRQAPFMFWLTDLSSRDPYFILPLIMGGAMLFQQKLNPPPADPMQAKVMQIMPVMFSAMFAFFPSGLVLYWVTNTLLSILQQWSINKKYAPGASVSGSN
tara:strand:- start:37 stop:1707 length:1671 start_codon:yes stop_codon:yes gene_type:complete